MEIFGKSLESPEVKQPETAISKFWEDIEKKADGFRRTTTEDNIKEWWNSLVNQGEEHRLSLREGNDKDSSEKTEESDVVQEKPLVENGEQFDDNGNLRPNIRYRTDDGEGREYYYETDEQGRIIKCETNNLQHKNREGRLEHNPDTPDKNSTDDAGHLIADRFGGSPELDNLVSQDSELNRRGGDWYAMEEEWAKAIEEGKTVEIEIEVKYEDDSGRPSSFDVYYTIDGEVHVKSFENEPKGAA